jgi:hypothetical protein
LPSENEESGIAFDPSILAKSTQTNDQDTPIQDECKEKEKNNAAVEEYLDHLQDLDRAK